MTNLSIDFDQVELALQSLGADINASEIHGTLCALLCANSANTGDNWFQSLVPAIEDSSVLQDNAVQTLISLCQEARQNINDPTCDFHLLLPSDDEDLATRTTALSDWCQGFIMGLMICGLKDFHKMPEDSAEAAKDILEISRASSAYDMDQSEDDEIALEELIEYVRVGVLLINEELNPDKKPAITSGNYNNLH
jgi:hypothetical protein